MNEAPKRCLFVTTEAPPMVGGVARCLHGWAEGLQLNDLSTSLLAVLPESMAARVAVIPEAIYRREYLLAPTRKASPVDRLVPLRMARSWSHTRDHEKRVRAAVDRLSEQVDPAIQIVAVLNRDCAEAARAAKQRGSAAIALAYAAEIRPARVERPGFLRRLLSGLDGVIAISEYTRGLVQDWGVPGSRVPVVHPPVGRNVMDAAAAWQRSGAVRPPGPFRVLTVCRLVERKGVQTVLEALAKLAADEVDFLYDIVGVGTYQPVLEKLVAEMGLTERVRFRGGASDEGRDELIAACDLFVMVPFEPADEDVEGFGIVYLEAGAFSKPVIASRSGGVPDAVLHGKTGVLIPPRDAEALAAEIRILVENPGLRIRMGEAGLQWASRHSPEQIGAEFRDCMLGLTMMGTR